MTTATIDDFDGGFDSPDLDGPEADLPALSERFAVTDDGRATWAMRKVRTAARRIAEVDAIAASEIMRVQEWAVRERAKSERALGFFTGMLQSYALLQRRLDGKHKSILTPYGRVSTREAQARLQVADEATYLAWAKIHAPGTVKTTTTTKPILSEITAVVMIADGQIAMTTGGEVVPGLTVIPVTLTATVTPEV